MSHNQTVRTRSARLKTRSSTDTKKRSAPKNLLKAERERIGRLAFGILAIVVRHLDTERANEGQKYHQEALQRLRTLFPEGFPQSKEKRS